MEDIYSFTLSQRHLIETEYYKLKSDNDDLFNDLDIDKICQYYESLLKEIEITNEKIIETKNAELEKIANSKKKGNKKLRIGIDVVEKLLDTYQDGIYGIINYFPSHSDDLLLKHISTKKYEFNNKPSIVSKLIKNNKFSSDAISDDYGMIFMYEKTEDELIDLKKIHLLKKGNIYKMNDVDTENDTETVYKIATKIYEFGSKIVLKEIIYESTIEELEEPNNLIDNIENEKKLLCLNDKKSKLEELYIIEKKYRKYVNDNVKSSDVREILLGFTFIKSLIKKITDPLKQQLDVQDIVKYNFSNKFVHLRISNRLDQLEYDHIIEKYFGENIENLTPIIIESYNLNKELSQYLLIFFDILCRIRIDEHLEYKSYCLNKNISDKKTLLYIIKISIYIILVKIVI